MVHIGDTLVSEAVLSEPFCCDLGACKGNCCNSEGESGAPLDEDELDAMREVIPIVWDDLTPRALQTIREVGPFFKDNAGDWVTTVVDGRDCVFCTYNDENVDPPLKGACLCAIEKAFREGRFTTLQGYRDGKEPFLKPISCQLYPIRLKQIGEYTAVNFDEQPKMCGCARKRGKKNGMHVFECAREGLVRRFGIEWYHELEICAEEIKKIGMI